MATGIVAIGVREHLGEGPLATVLALTGALLYLVALLVLLRRRVAPGTPTALSFVAGSGGLAALGPGVPAALLTAAAIAVWVVIAAAGRPARPRTATGALPGGALLATVATQAVVVAAGAELGRRHGAGARDLVLGRIGALGAGGGALHRALPRRRARSTHAPAAAPGR